MNIVVTGGAGYIGAVMVPQLLEGGHHVTVIDNFMYEQTSLLDVARNPKLQVVRGDVRSHSIVEEHVKRADVVIPLAAYVGAPLCAKDPVGARSVNRDSIFMLLKILSKNQVVVMPTTNSAYGSGDGNNYCDESSPLRPISQYAIEKVEVEKELLQHPKAVSLRLATVFGASPRMRIDLLVNDFVYRAVNDRFVVLFESHFKRNYIHVHDVSRAFMHVLDNIDTMSGEVYNVGLSTANLSKWELCEVISHHVKDFVYLDAPVGVDPDQRNYLVSNEKIEKTGFIPEHSLDDGVRELVKAFQILRNRKYGNV